MTLKRGWCLDCKWTTDSPMLFAVVLAMVHIRRNAGHVAFCEDAHGWIKMGSRYLCDEPE